MKHFESSIPFRSQKYQYLIKERSVSYSFLSSFTNEDGIVGWLNPFNYSEERLELQDKIKDRFYQLLKDNTTNIQYKIFTMMAQGKTQMEIAAILNVNQSSIVKSWIGNTDYKKKDKNGNYVKYGGTIKKMKRVIEEDSVIQNLLTQLKDYL